MCVRKRGTEHHHAPRRRAPIGRLSMPKPVCPDTATATLFDPPGPQTGAEAARRVARAGRQPSGARICLSEGAARRISASVRRACSPDTYAASGPEPGTWKDPDPRRRSSRDQEAQNRPACPAMAASVNATPTACPVSMTSWRYGLRRTCRLVTGRSHRPRSTWPNQARLALLAVTHRYNGHIVFGSDNFRSPNICCFQLHCLCSAANTDHSILRVRADRGGCAAGHREQVSAHH